MVVTSGRGARPASVPGASQVPVLYEKDKEARELSLALFQRLDIDRSGHLSQDELLHARTVMLCQEEATQNVVGNLTSLAPEADTNNDMLIDEEEWHDFIGSLYEVMGRKQFLMVVRAWVATKLPDPAGCGAALVPKDSSEKPRQGPEEAAQAGEAAPGEQEALGDSPMTVAAMRIQSVQRGKEGRRQAALEKQKRQGKRKGTLATEQPLSTLGDLWESLCLSDGIVKTSVEVIELVRLFERAKLSGVDMQLVACVPMHFTDCGEPEDLSAGEVVHLCMMLLDSPELTVHEARAALEPIKAACREDAAQGMDYYAVDPAAALNFRRFKTLLPMLAALMRVDMQYLVSQMLWHRTGRFELPDPLGAVLVLRCVRKGGRLGSQGALPEVTQVTPDDLWESLAAGTEVSPQGLPNTEVLAQKFMLDDFVRLCYNCGLVDATGKMGITYTDMSGLFTRVLAKLPELLKAHAQRARRPQPPPFKGRNEYLAGRTELEILLQELSREPSMQRQHTSPLRMVLWLITKAQEVHLLQEPKQVEAAQHVLREKAKRGRWQ